MTIHIHFLNNVRTGLTLFNVAHLEDLGNSTIKVHNAFGGDAKTFTEVDHIEVEPARADDDDEDGE